MTVKPPVRLPTGRSRSDWRYTPHGPDAVRQAAETTEPPAQASTPRSTRSGHTHYPERLHQVQVGKETVALALAGLIVTSTNSIRAEARTDRETFEKHIIRLT